MSGLAVVFVVLVLALGLVLVVRAGEREWAEATADREWQRSIDRRPVHSIEFPPAVSGLRPAPRPYDWALEAEVLELRPRARTGGAA